MFSLKTVFRRMIETSTKSAWWTVLFKLGSIVMCIILMILIIVIASVIASSVATWSMKVTATATATSTLIIAVVIIVIATTRRIKLPMVTLKLASIIILLSPSPLLRPPVWPPTVILSPIGSGSSYLCLHTALPVQGEGEVVEVAVVILLYLCFSFLCDR